MKLYAGTSGFSYPEWRGTFYPEDLDTSGMLAYYAARLGAVEINQTFYRMPREDVLEGWASGVPAGFRFVLKASRRITHFKRLAGVEEDIAYFLRNAAALGPHGGAVLYQLPPNFSRDLSRLRDFLDALPNPGRSAFEFRHVSWFEEEVFTALADRGSALCLAETDEGEDPPREVTAEWGYLRLRKAAYTEQELDAWAAWLEGRGDDWKEAYVFFKHEESGAGPANARRLLELVQDGPPSGPETGSAP